MTSTQVVTNHAGGSKSNSDPFQPESKVAQLLTDKYGPDVFIATGARARTVNADLQELRRLRLKSAGGSVFQRGRSRFLQIKYLVDGKWRYESAGTTKRAHAERFLSYRVYESSAGLLPGTATSEQIVEHFLRDARLRGLRSTARLERACKQLLKKLAGHRAEQINRALWLKYIDERQQEAAPDTVHLELSIARRAYRVARASGLLREMPDIPQVRHLNVRAGFIEPRDWAKLREHLLPDLRDACDFALSCGAREMEVLSLRWLDIEPESKVAHLRSTKTDTPRKVPYGQIAQLAEVIERRRVVDARLKREAIISPWVLCFAEPIKIRGRVYHRAGVPLFGQGEHGLHTHATCESRRRLYEGRNPARAVPRFQAQRRAQLRARERAALGR
jgi:integrase